MIILRVICQQPCVLVLHVWTVNTHRLLEINEVNIPAKSKWGNTWNYLNKLFIKKQFV